MLTKKWYIALLLLPDLPTGRGQLPTFFTLSYWLNDRVFFIHKKRSFSIAKSSFFIFKTKAAWLLLWRISLLWHRKISRMAFLYIFYWDGMPESLAPLAPMVRCSFCRKSTKSLWKMAAKTKKALWWNEIPLSVQVNLVSLTVSLASLNALISPCMPFDCRLLQNVPVLTHICYLCGTPENRKILLWQMCMPFAVNPCALRQNKILWYNTPFLIVNCESYKILPPWKKIPRISLVQPLTILKAV